MKVELGKIDPFGKIANVTAIESDNDSISIKFVDKIYKLSHDGISISDGGYSEELEKGRYLIRVDGKEFYLNSRNGHSDEIKINLRSIQRCFCDNL